MKIQKIMIIGSGLMGSGIAQVCAQAGIQVFLHDVSKDVLEKAIKNINWSIGKFIQKGSLTEDHESIIGRINLITDIKSAQDVELTIEAVFEKLELKQEIFQKLDELKRRDIDAVLATIDGAPLTWAEVKNILGTTVSSASTEDRRQAVNRLVDQRITVHPGIRGRADLVGIDPRKRRFRPAALGLRSDTTRSRRAWW